MEAKERKWIQIRSTYGLEKDIEVIRKHLERYGNSSTISDAIRVACVAYAEQVKKQTKKERDSE
jgi:hypothetical protein